MVVILPLTHVLVAMKQLIFDHTRQNGYQTVPFGVYIPNLMFVFILE